MAANAVKRPILVVAGVGNGSGTSPPLLRQLLAHYTAID